MSIDRNYILLQFREKIHTKKGIEFQSFFESIMKKAFPKFQIIRPYGNQGDGGNDGYIKDSGTYYQVYAPNEPKVNESLASKKLEEDFNKLKRNWDEITKIKKYFFVFNNKYEGSTIELQRTISNLEKANPNIKFDLLLAKDLETIFFEHIKEEDYFDLNFDDDQRQTIKLTIKILDNIRTELDKEDMQHVEVLLNNIEQIIYDIDDENSIIRFKLYKARYLENIERVEETICEYNEIIKKYPNNIDAFLSLAEVFLKHYKNLNKIKELLIKAEKIDSSSEKLKFLRLLSMQTLNEYIDLTSVDENSFPKDKRLKACFYRLYALEYSKKKLNEKAVIFIEKAIAAYPESFNNYVVKIYIFVNNLIKEKSEDIKILKAKEILKEVESIKNNFINVSARNELIIKILSIDVLKIINNTKQIEMSFEEAFKLILRCYFDKQIEYYIYALYLQICVPEEFLEKVKIKIMDRIEISDELSKFFFVQFNFLHKPFQEIKEFFKKFNKNNFINFMNDIEHLENQKILDFLKDDVYFKIAFISSLDGNVDLLETIIESLEDKNIKISLKIYVYYKNKNFDKAFELLKELNLKELTYADSIQIIEIFEHKKAYDLEIVVLENLISKNIFYEQNFYFKTRLFNAYFVLKKHKEIIDLGKTLLCEDKKKNILNIKNKEILLMNTLVSYFEVAKLDSKYYIEAKEIFEKYSNFEKTFEFKIYIGVMVYANLGEYDKALDVIIDAVKEKKVLHEKEYAQLHMVFLSEIKNTDRLSADSLTKIEDNCFVKIKDDNWYFIGEGNELDVIKIPNKSKKYDLYIGKNLNEKIIYFDEVNNTKKEFVIEKIYKIEQYILYRTGNAFVKLTRNNDLEGVIMVELPTNKDTGEFNTNNLENFVKKTTIKSEDFFNRYCEKENIPLSLLSINCYGLLNTIAYIQNEERGYINCSSGTKQNLDLQKSIAQNIINKKLPFYIDMTSFIFLSERGILKRIFNYIPNICVAQSVINSFYDIGDKFSEGALGYIGYAKNNIVINNFNKNNAEKLKHNFLDSVNLFEKSFIKNLSPTDKQDCFCEQKIPAELIDTCILAQKDNIPILTEDPLTLFMDNLETKKNVPHYFCSIVLMKVLYENGKITFDEYLDYFYYLSSYRFRFLSFSLKDIEFAIFGDNKIKKININNIHKLNFKLTLSEEYGVPFQNAINIISNFLFIVLSDNSIPIEILQKIFIEILEDFPLPKNKNKNKTEIGLILLKNCLYKLNLNNQNRKIINLNNGFIKNKILMLSSLLKIYGNRIIKIN